MQWIEGTCSIGSLDLRWMPLVYGKEKTPFANSDFEGAVESKNSS